MDTKRIKVEETAVNGHDHPQESDIPLSSRDHDTSDVSKDKSIEDANLLQPASLTLEDEDILTSAKAESDSRKLLNIFPEEVWLLVFDKVSNTDDLESISNSSLLLRHFLLPQREHFLLPKFLGIFIGSKFSDTRQYCSYGGNYNPNMISKNPLPLNELDEDNSGEQNPYKKWACPRLKLRLVNRSWCQAIDSFYENHPFHFKLQAKPDGLHEIMLRRLMVTTFSDEFHTHFLPHFHNSHNSYTSRNPFIGRHVVLIFEATNGAHATEFEQLSRNILTKYGHHIWYCTIMSGDPPHLPAPIFEMRRSESYVRMKEWLNQMPNLKAFRIKYLGMRQLRQREGAIDLHGELLVPRLQSLQFLSAANLPYQTFRELLRANKQVSTLGWYREPDRISLEEHHNICTTVQLPNLKTLSYQIFSQKDFQNLADCPHAKWPLEKLVLEFGENVFLDWQEIFNVLHSNWGETLTNLELKLPEAKDEKDRKKIDREGPSYWLNLPQLKTLRLTMHNLACLDFLLPMKNSLTILDLQVYLQNCRYEKTCELVESLEQVERGNIIELLGCVKAPLESNIWTTFCKLKWVHFKMDGCYISGSDKVIKWSYNREEWKMNRT